MEGSTFDPGATEQQVASSHNLCITVYYSRLLVLYYKVQHYTKITGGGARSPVDTESPDSIDISDQYRNSK